MFPSLRRVSYRSWVIINDSCIFYKKKKKTKTLLKHIITICIAIQNTGVCCLNKKNLCLHK